MSYSACPKCRAIISPLAAPHQCVGPAAPAPLQWGLASATPYNWAADLAELLASGEYGRIRMDCVEKVGTVLPEWAQLKEYQRRNARERWCATIDVVVSAVHETVAAAAAAPRLREGPPDTELALRLARHLCEIQSEDGCDYVGQESNDLMWLVAKRFGLRTKMVTHAPTNDCPYTDTHNYVECGMDGAPLEFEPNPDALRAVSCALPKPTEAAIEAYLDAPPCEIGEFESDCRACALIGLRAAYAVQFGRGGMEGGTA
jgi:hypothetical protein